jgi:Outer membrane protein
MGKKSLFLKLFSALNLILILAICIFMQPTKITEAIQNGRNLTVYESISIALSENPSIEASNARIIASAAKMAQAKAAFFPTLILENEYMRMDAPSLNFTKTIDSRMLSFQTDFNNPKPLNNYETGLSLRYNIYKGGKDWYGLKQAKIGNNMMKSQHKELINYLVFSVVTSYYDVLAAKEQVKVAMDSKRTVEAQLNKIKILYEGGAVLKSDLLSLEVRLAEARERLIVARNSFELTKVAFATLLGISSKPSFTLSEEVWQPAALPDNVDEAISIARENRGLIKVVRHEVDKAEATIKKARGGYLPEASILSRYYFDDEDLGYDGERKNWFIAVRVDWTLFDGFLTKNRVNESKAYLREAEADLKEAFLHVEKEVRSANLLLSEAKARLDVTSASVAQAEESLRLVKLSYDGGATDVTRYLDAELDLTTARTFHINSSYDIKKAIANCLFSMGYCGICARELDEDQ